MLRAVLSLLVLTLSVAGSCVAAHAYDPRIDPDAASRSEISYRTFAGVSRWR